MRYRSGHYTAFPCATASGRYPLLQMLRYELGHLKHVHCCFAAKHNLERRITFDHPFVLGVLQLVLLDLGP
jgi:hypothetical protein